MESARNIAAAQTKKLREYAKPREYLSGEASLRVRNISERRYIYGDERRAEMERLTERFNNGQAAVMGCGENCKYDYKYCRNHYEDCPEINRIYESLAEYEDTGLTPEQIRELRERDKPRKIELNAGVPICPVCGRRVVRCYDFCPDCGHRLEQ